MIMMIRVVLNSTTTTMRLSGRVIKLELAKEAGDLHDRCIPRKPKAKRDGGYLVISCTAQGNNNKG